MSSHCGVVSVVGGRAGCWSASRLLTAPACSSFLALGGALGPVAGSVGVGDLVAGGADGAAFGRGDGLAVDVVQLVGGARAPAGGQPGDERGGEGAQRGVVVFAGLDEALVAGGEGRVDLAGSVGG